MTKRIALLGALILSLTLLPGCPGAVNAVVGSWIITLDMKEFGLQLNANGEAIPFMVDSLLPGSFTWEVAGTRVLFHQVNGDDKIVYAAELFSDMLIGAAVSWAIGDTLGNSNTFTAVKQ